MACFDGNKLAHDGLLDIAKHCVQAALHAPQLTGVLRTMTQVLSDDDLRDWFYVEEEMHRVGWRTSAEHYKQAYDKGEPPVLLLIGADCSRSELTWDCGACGFNSCHELNSYSRENQGFGWIWKGPNCAWKTIDLGIACDWAAAAAHNYNVDCRVAAFPGGIFIRMGYLEGCTIANCLPLGPCVEHWYFEPGSRRIPAGYSYQAAADAQMINAPSLWIQFTGPGLDWGRQPMKAQDRFWERPKRYLKVVDDPEWDQFAIKRYQTLLEATNKVRQKKGLAPLKLGKGEEALLLHKGGESER